MNQETNLYIRKPPSFPSDDIEIIPSDLSPVNITDIVFETLESEGSENLYLPPPLVSPSPSPSPSTSPSVSTSPSTSFSSSPSLPLTKKSILRKKY